MSFLNSPPNTVGCFMEGVEAGDAVCCFAVPKSVPSPMERRVPSYEALIDKTKWECTFFFSRKPVQGVKPRLQSLLGEVETMWLPSRSGVATILAHDSPIHYLFTLMIPVAACCKGSSWGYSYEVDSQLSEHLRHGPWDRSCQGGRHWHIHASGSKQSVVTIVDVEVQSGRVYSMSPHIPQPLYEQQTVVYCLLEMQCISDN